MKKLGPNEFGWRTGKGASMDPDLGAPFVVQKVATKTKPFEKHRHNTREDRYQCAHVTPLGHPCAELVDKRGRLCKRHRKLANRTAKRWVRPELRSEGKIISSSRKPSNIRPVEDEMTRQSDDERDPDSTPDGMTCIEEAPDQT